MSDNDDLVYWFGLRVDGEREFLDVIRWNRPGRPTIDDFHTSNDWRVRLLAPLAGRTIEIVQVSITNISYDDVDD